mmetsp:Transcript_38712/g.111143  ORF Transcript_38712/g.111143 Transcript_38712/m.111143 type:complete len:247 (+) Transcript_38712:2987-3727(+)
MVHQKPCHRRFRMQQEHRRLLVRLQWRALAGRLRTSKREAAGDAGGPHRNHSEGVEVRAPKSRSPGPIAEVAVVKELFLLGLHEFDRTALDGLFRLAINVLLLAEVGAFVNRLFVRDIVGAWESRHGQRAALRVAPSQHTARWQRPCCWIGIRHGSHGVHPPQHVALGCRDHDHIDVFSLCALGAGNGILALQRANLRLALQLLEPDQLGRPNVADELTRLFDVSRSDHSTAHPRGAVARPLLQPP